MPVCVQNQSLCKANKFLMPSSWHYVVKKVTFGCGLYSIEGDIGLCGIAVLVNFTCGISVILILNCVIAVFSESAG